MPTPLVQVGASGMCPHGGQLSIISTNVRVTVGGQPLATLGDQFLIAGCAFTIPPGKPQPCLKVQWLVPAGRVTIGGQPAILQTSSGLCLTAEQIPQGPPTVTVAQMRVLGT
jgi:uncharacterized Zn-binding protein involved in type VI secretion